MKVQIGVVQMNSTDSLKENLAYATAQIQNAASEGLDLVTFPETFLYIGQDHPLIDMDSEAESISRQ